MTEEENQNSVREEKRKRIIVALTVGAVLLMVILLSVMVYQLISIFSLKKQNDDLEQMIDYYLALTDEEKQKTEASLTKDYIILEARKLGYKLPNDLS